MKLFFVKTVLNSLFLLLVIGMLINACKHEPEVILNSGGNGSPNPTPTNDSVCFSTQVLPLIQANCATSGCHDNITREEGLALTSYSGIMRIVKPFDTGSDLIKEITRTSSKRMPPPPMAALSTESIDLLKKWISQGAKNTSCSNSDCDTLTVSYQAQITPVINTYCKGCHQSSNAGGGILLETYAQVKTQTESGKLICSIKWGSCSAMPKGGSKLSFCSIRKFEKWQAAGFPQ